MKTVAITGSRSIKDKQAVWHILDRVFPNDAMMIHGGAIGVDTFADEWAKSRGVPVQGYGAGWHKIGHKGAGMIRNGFLVDKADEVISIWDGKSTGTADAVEKARKQRKKCVQFCIPPSVGPLSAFMVRPGD
ncbi:putative GTP-binding protein [Delftia phage PhiW-14]|uniref:Putative GTP-binding protein n=1 Tax=Delftia phage PhiW-14 TaxID=665032 RepID=C9DGI0_BPW14|nr:GTP-binding domain [Delftia phage PhiW-14]ACV50231.1 putative GTP-binding protein [Delftia phage PhiW-14]